MGNKRRKNGSRRNRRSEQVAGVARGLDKALDLAERRARQGPESDIVELLAEHEPDYPFSAPETCARFNRLFALGLSCSGDFARAEEVVKRALKDQLPSQDVLFAKALTELSMREFEGAIKSCQSFLELYQGDSYASANPQDITVTPIYESQVKNFLGAALGQLRRDDEAIGAFRAAIESDPGNPLPYLNLAGLYRRLNHFDLAIQVVEDGLGQCRQIDELRMLRESLDHRQSISACLMVKNEEELLPGCLESLRDWVDEVIVVDTGSTDRTVEIAKEYGARVFHQPWENDFSKHRNYSIEQATGDWVFIIDADERIVGDDVPLILEAINAGAHDILSISVNNVYGEHQDRITFTNSIRFFKRSLGLRYEGIVHNALVVPAEAPVLRTRIRLTHLGYDLTAEKMDQKFERTRALLQKQLHTEPDNIFALFNYAELLRGRDPVIRPENADEIIRCATRVVELTSPDDRSQRHLHLMCLCQLAAVHLQLKQFDQARQFSTQALAVRPDYFDALIFSGFAYHGLKEYGRAIEQFERYLKVQNGFDGTSEEDPVIMTYPHSRDLASNNLGILYQLTGNTERARECYRETLRINPHYGETASLLGRLLQSEGDIEQAGRYYRHQLDHAGATVDSLIGLAQIASDQHEFDTAEGLLVQGVKSFPEDYRINLELGRHLAAGGREVEALASFDLGLALSGDDGLLATIAGFCFEHQLWNAAANYYQRAIERQGETPELLNDLGNCHFKLKDLIQAEKAYIRATEIPPTLPLAYRNLGMVQARLGKPNQAISALESFLSVSPGEWEVRLLAADVCRQSGQFMAAVGHYEKILLDQPQNVAALLGLSESYYLMGHKDTALMGFQRVLLLEPASELALARVQSMASPVH